MNSKSYSSFIHLLGYLIAALAVVQIILMFLPYYSGEMTTKEGEVVQIAASIQSFTWVRFADFEEHFLKVVGENYFINDHITGPITSLVLCGFTLFQATKGVHKIMAMLSGLACGVGGLICFALTPLLAYGNQVIFVACMVVFALIAVLSLANIVLYILDARTRIKV